MKISIASDHRGTETKKTIMNALKEAGHEVIDYSPNNNETDDYPDFAYLVGKSITKKESEIGLLICGSGIGMSIAANKIKGVRCARLCCETDAYSSRAHNGANIAALSSDMPLNDLAKIVKMFISTKADSDERHQRRISKIIKLEAGEYTDV